MSALVIGFGNPDRGDDAAGPLVARLLAGGVAATVLERHGDALALLEAWEGAASLVLVDAAAPMGSPGRIHRLDITANDLPRDLAFGSTHAFGLPEAVALSRRLGTLPPRAVVHAIEGGCFDPGAPVSPAVAAAVEAVAAMHCRRACGVIRAALAARAAHRHVAMRKQPGMVFGCCATGSSGSWRSRSGRSTTSSISPRKSAPRKTGAGTGRNLSGCAARRRAERRLHRPAAAARTPALPAAGAASAGA